LNVDHQVLDRALLTAAEQPRLMASVSDRLGNGAMADYDFGKFIKELSQAVLLKRTPSRLKEFREQYRHEIFVLFDNLYQIELIGGDTDVYADDPGSCDSCGTDLAAFRWFIDGALASGAWGNMCPKCFVENGTSLGWGAGQLYYHTKDNRWRLVAGGDPET
jgi:hypothetical protein